MMNIQDLDVRHSEFFYMVYCPEKNKPKMCHAKYQEAKESAEKLAKKCPGDRFYILKAVGVSVEPDPSVITRRLKSPVVMEK